MSRPGGTAGLFLVVLGVTLALVAWIGVAVPLLDQWDAEWARLYDPYLAGTLPLATLVEAHNEHRILVTRLLDLGLLELSGGWDPLLQMLIEALLRALAGVVLLAWLRPLWPTGRAGVLAIAALALLLAVPFAPESVLSGFQSEFILLTLCGVAGIGFCVTRPTLSRGWWVSVVLAVVAYFNVASAPLVLLASLVVRLAQGRAAERTALAGAAIQLGLAGLMLAALPAIDGGDPWRARTAEAFWTGFAYLAGWPIRGSAVAPLLVWLPSAMLGWSLLRRRPPAEDRGWVCLGLALWVLAQDAALAYGRAEGGAFRAPRYLDLAVVGLVANATALAWLLRARPAGRRRVPAGAGGLWLGAIALFLLLRTGGVAKELHARAEVGAQQVRTLHDFLAGDAGALARGDPIAYPDPDRLARLARMPGVDGLLDPGIVDDPAARAAARRRLRLGGALAAPVRWVRDALLAAGPAIAALGTALLLASAMARDRRVRGL